VAVQDIANRLIGNRIPEIGQGAHNPVIAPVSVLARHANDQLLDLSLDPRPARDLTGLRAIEFAGDKLFFDPTPPSITSNRLAPQNSAGNDPN
jgi:hypothetical protein